MRVRCAREAAILRSPEIRLRIAHASLRSQASWLVAVLCYITGTSAERFVRASRDDIFKVHTHLFERSAVELHDHSPVPIVNYSATLARANKGALNQTTVNGRHCAGAV